MDAFRESARKLFGCRGIYVSTYTTPMNSYPTPNVPVIVNYIGCAGWLCRHFYDYYRFTGDEELLRSEILPFMLETAAFYEDYLTHEADGKIRIEPSVSPENSPGRFMPGDFHEHIGPSQSSGLEFNDGFRDPPRAACTSVGAEPLRCGDGSAPR